MSLSISIVSPQTLPDLLGAESWDGMRAYKVTKLIQTHYAYALKETLNECEGESVAVSPGQLLETSTLECWTQG